MAETKQKLPLKTQMLIWRARFSTPALLARFDEKKVVACITGINAGLAIFVLSLTAWLTDLPLVFPALGPSAFILFSAPLSKAGAPRSVVLGHWICLATGFCVWHLISYIAGEPVSMGNGDWSVLVSASLTLAFCGILMVRFSCPHPPACASGLVVGLGAITAVPDILFMAGAIGWLAFQAYGMNRWAGLPVPFWSYKEREI